MPKDDAKTLYKQDNNMMATFEEREYEQEPIVIECVGRRAQKELANGKAPDDDEIPIELFKVVGEQAIRILTATCMHN